MNVRRAHDGERPAVMTVLDAGLLAVTAAEVGAAIADGRVLVAEADGPVLGVLVLGAAEPAGWTPIEAIAVRPGRRGRGVGSALVRDAAARHGDLVAEFDAGVRPFWTSLGFAVEPAPEPDRFVGRLPAGDR